MASAPHTITGTFRPHPRGFGFLDVADGASAFVPPPKARQLLDGDEVTARVVDNDRGPTVNEITQFTRRRRYLTGAPGRRNGETALHPHPQLGTSPVPAAADGPLARLKGGDWVVAELRRSKPSQPRVTTLPAGPYPAGSVDAIRADALVRALDGVAHRGDRDLAAAGGSAVVHDRWLAELLAGEDPSAPTERPDPTPGPPRQDHTDRVTITIDGEHSRDLDDAVSAERLDAQHIRVWVHIADVASAVPEGSALDVHAATLATSLYLADGNAPMLPRDLSEHTLSLLPQQDRNTLTAAFTVRDDGTVTDVTVDASQIRSDARLDYRAVQQHLDGAGDAIPAVAVETLDHAAAAAAWLGAGRDARATLDGLFSDPDLDVAVVDGAAALVPAGGDGAAHQLIERLMVAANEAVAGWLIDRGVPALFRVHDGVDRDRSDRLEAAAARAGHPLSGLDASAIDAARGDAGSEAAAAMIETAAADALGRACYRPSGDHHFGLGSRPYTHFTSPIRRYADLMVHRAVHATLAGRTPTLTGDALTRTAEWISRRSGAATRAEALERAGLWGIVLGQRLAAGREVTADAVVQRLAPAGASVRLPSWGVGGFVPAELLAGDRQLDVDDDALATTDGRVQVGAALPVRLAEVDATGRLVFVAGR